VRHVCSLDALRKLDDPQTCVAHPASQIARQQLARF